MSILSAVNRGGEDVLKEIAEGSVICRIRNEPEEHAPNILAVTLTVGQSVKVEVAEGIFLETMVDEVSGGGVVLVFACTPPYKFTGIRER